MVLSKSSFRNDSHSLFLADHVRGRADLPLDPIPEHGGQAIQWNNFITSAKEYKLSSYHHLI